MLLMKTTSLSTNAKINTNDIFRNKSTDDFYLPAYTRLVFKKITDVDINSQSAKISGTLLISIYFGELPFTEEHFSSLEIAINNEQNFKLTADNCKIKFDSKKKEVQYTYRSVLDLELECDVFLTPFLQLSLQLTVSIRSLKVQVNNTTYILKFNMMDYHGDNSVKFSMQAQGGQNDTGDYGLIANSLRVKYKKELQHLVRKKDLDVVELEMNDYLKLHSDIEQEEQELEGSSSKIAPSFEQTRYQMLVSDDHTDLQKQKGETKDIPNYQHALFSFSIYKFPFLDIFIIFLPLQLLTIINLMIFFQDYGLGGRVASIATLMIAYSTFLPTIRSRIPPTPNFTLMDIIAQFSILSSLLCLIRAYTVKDFDSSIKYDWTQDGLFITCLIFVIGNAFTIACLCIWHKFISERSHKKVFKIKGVKSNIKFNRRDWSHPQCQKQFSQYDFFVPYEK